MVNMIRGVYRRGIKVIILILIISFMFGYVSGL